MFPTTLTQILSTEKWQPAVDSTLGRSLQVKGKALLGQIHFAIRTNRFAIQTNRFIILDKSVLQPWRLEVL